MAKIETYMSIIGNVVERFTAMTAAADRTAAAVTDISTDIDIGVDNPINRLADVSAAVEQTAAAFDDIPAAAEQASAAIADMPSVIDIGTGDTVDDMGSINTLIDDVLARFSELKESASFIEYNEIEKLELMKRELDNNNNRISLLNEELSETKQKWDEVAATSGRSSEAAKTLEDKYQRLDKNVITLEKSNNRLLTQINKQVDALEGMKTPAEDVTEQIEEQVAAVEEVTSKIEEQAAAVEEITYPSDELEEMKRKVEELERNQEKYNQKLREADSAAEKLGNKISGYIKAFISMAAIKKGFESTVGAAAELSQQLQMVQGMFGNADVGEAYFAKLQQYAFESGQAMSDLADITQQFMSSTRNTDSLMGLTNIAEKLSIKNPDQGLDGAGYAINEALSGQYTSLKNRFNLTAAQLEPIKKAVEAGNMEGIIAAFDEGLNMAGITDEIVDTYRNTAPQQFASIANGFADGFAQAGMSALTLLEPTLARIKEWLDSESAANFFNNIAMGINFITTLFTGFFDFVTTNWDVLSAVLAGVAVVLAILAINALTAKDGLIATGIAGIASGLKTAAAWAMAHIPLLILITVVASLIAAFIKAGGKIEDVIGAIGGTIAVLWTFISNGIAYIWNMFVSFAEFIANIFVDPVYAIQKLFYDLALNVLKFFQGLVNGVVSAVNWLIEKVNGVFGSEFNPIESTFMDEIIAKVEAKVPTSDKDVYDFSDMKIEFKDYAEEWNKGYEKGSSLPGAIADTFEGFDSTVADLGAYNAEQLDSIGSDANSIAGNTADIKDSIDISSEDLKYLKDIAEQESINQFTTKAIVPQLQVTFGDVKETADVDKIVGRITQMVEEELSVMSEGVHV